MDTVYAGMPETILYPVDGMAEVVDAVLAKGFHVYLLSTPDAS